MLANVIFGVRDMKRATSFYDAAFGALGYKRVSTGEKFTGYGPAEKANFFICTPRNGQPATAGNGTQLTVSAPDTAAVDKFHKAALAAGGTCEGPPGFRPPEKKTSYAAYVRDPDGNKVMAACSNPK
jgi:catechol 2,3-dioxygenase-like lactoylglutathione lyase family enzyme